MDRAWCKELNRIITDYELYFEHNEQNSYECWCCSITVTPCATIKGEYKRKPYFKLLPKTNHKSDCCYYKDAYASIKSYIATGNVTSLPVPQIFTLRKDPEKTAGNEFISSNHLSITTPKSTSNPSNVKRERKHTTSFQSVVDAFAISPEDISKVSLRFEGIVGSTYGEIFSIIYNTNSKYKSYGNKPKVFWVPMSWKTHALGKNNIIIPLNPGLWKENKFIKPYSLSIDITQWQSNYIKQFLYRYKTALEIIRGAPHRKGYLAFVGTQNQEDKFYFNSDNYRLITTVIVGE